MREETLRTARLRRIDREREAERQEKAREEYKERYDGAARRYRMFMVGMPILLVTSYYLYQQCEYLTLFVSPGIGLTMGSGVGE